MAAQLGLQINSIIAALGAAAVAIALAVKDSLSNVASGILIIITKPFKVGDYIEIEGWRAPFTNRADVYHTDHRGQ